MKNEVTAEAIADAIGISAHAVRRVVQKGGQPLAKDHRETLITSSEAQYIPFRTITRPCYRFEIKHPCGYGRVAVYRGSMQADERAVIGAVWEHMQALDREKWQIISARIWRVRPWWFDERVAVLTLGEKIVLEDRTFSGWAS